MLTRAEQLEIIKISAFFGIGIGYILSPLFVILIAFVFYFIILKDIILSLIIGMVLSAIMGLCYAVFAIKHIRSKKC